MKIIVYGLGDVWKQNQEWIQKEYEVVGACDGDPKKQAGKGIKMLTRKELKDLPDSEYDAVLVTPLLKNLAQELQNDLEISQEKIMLFSEVKDTMSMMHQWYGQEYEDAVCTYILDKIQKPLNSVRYLEIGVFDPVVINNTFYFYLRGARGVLVDANPAIRETCAVYRREDQFLNYAVSAETLEEKQAFYVAENKGLSSLSQDIIEIHKEKNRAGAVVETVIEVEVIGINDLLKKIGYVPDLVSIDIEGEDKKTMQAWDFDLYRPILFVVEIVETEFTHFMKQKGYLLFTVMGSNSIFLNAEYRKYVEG